MRRSNLNFGGESVIRQGKPVAILRRRRESPKERDVLPSPGWNVARDWGENLKSEGRDDGAVGVRKKIYEPM